MKVAAPPQIYILQRSCHHNPEPINLNLFPILFLQLIEEISVIPLFGNLLQCAILGEFFESRFDLISQLLFILVHDDDSLIDFEWKELQQQRWQQISEMFS